MISVKNTNRLIVLGLVILSFSCHEKIPVEKKERVDISGTWVLKSNLSAQNMSTELVVPSELALSDVVLITYDGEDYYSVKSIKNIGENPIVGNSIVLKLEYKGATEYSLEEGSILLTDSKHVFRFSLSESPMEFDMEIAKRKTAIDEVNWIWSGRYMKCE